MHAETGRLYTWPQVEQMAAEQRAELVEIVGTPEQVQAVSRAVSAEYRRNRKARNKAQRASRRANRRMR